MGLAVSGLTPVLEKLEKMVPKSTTEIFRRVPSVTYLKNEDTHSLRVPEWDALSVEPAFPMEPQDVGFEQFP